MRLQRWRCKPNGLPILRCQFQVNRAKVKHVVHGVYGKTKPLQASSQTKKRRQFHPRLTRMGVGHESSDLLLKPLTFFRQQRQSEPVKRSRAVILKPQQH